MATDSWALAVDEQEAAVKSVSGFSGEKEVGGSKWNPLLIQGAPLFGQADGPSGSHP